MKNNRGSFIAVIGVFFGVSLFLSAGVEGSAKIPNLTSEVKVAVSSPKDWTAEVGVGGSFSNIRHSGGDDYTLLNSDLMFAYAVDEVSLNGWRRGYTEWVAGTTATAVLSGPENHLFGISFGPRYNFVQEGWKVIPFVGVQIGGLFADSQGSRMNNSHGLGQDFSFSLQLESGVKIPITPDFFIRLTALYTHVSNGGLSEDNHHANNDIDAVGGRVGFGTEF